METAKTWCVYKHTTPSGKVYIGITHHSNPNARFGKDGKNYSRSTVFWKAIMKYGWENISHEILYRNLSEKEAKAKEVELIRYYRDLGISYNMTIGGDGHNFGKQSETAEYRTKQSRIYKEKHPEYDKEQYEKHSEAIKQRARDYYRRHREEVLAYKRTEAVKAKARERAATWRQKHPDYMKQYMKKYNQNKNCKDE